MFCLVFVWIPSKVSLMVVNTGVWVHLREILKSKESEKQAQVLCPDGPPQEDSRWAVRRKGSSVVIKPPAPDHNNRRSQVDSSHTRFLLSGL